MHEMLLVRENKRRVLAVKNDGINLVAEIPSAIDDVGARNLVSFGQVLGEHINPNGFACIAFCTWMLEGLPRC